MELLLALELLFAPLSLLQLLHVPRSDDVKFDTHMVRLLVEVDEVGPVGDDLEVLLLEPVYQRISLFLDKTLEHDRHVEELSLLALEARLLLLDGLFERERTRERLQVLRDVSRVLRLRVAPQVLLLLVNVLLRRLLCLADERRTFLEHPLASLRCLYKFY